MASPMDHTNGSEPDFDALAAFVDDRLGRSERARLLEHLASCERCRTIVAELVRTRAPTRSVRSFPGVALPLAASLMVAVAGGGLYWLVRTPSSSQIPPAVEPSRPTPPAPAQPSSPGVTPGVAPSFSTSGTPNSGKSATSPDAPDRTRAAGTRSVGSRTFRLVAGEWIDVDYRLTDLMTVVDVRSVDDLRAHPALGPFTALGRRFTVVVDGTVYRVAIPPE
jgi:anti-sigma factor RsiW